jgi:hypothetical protein
MLGPMTCARGRGTALALAVSAIVSFWSALAAACPACVGSDARYASFLKIGSLFVLVPFLVLCVVLYVLRQAPERFKIPAGGGGRSSRRPSEG